MLNVGQIQGGDWASNVPLECTVTGRMSFPINWPVERAQRLVEDSFVAAARVIALLIMEWCGQEFQ